MFSDNKPRERLQPSPHNYIGCKKHLIVIPGFLTDKNNRIRKITDFDDYGKCNWFKFVASDAVPKHINAYYFNWPSNNIKKIIIELYKHLALSSILGISGQIIYNVIPQTRLIDFLLKIKSTSDIIRIWKDVVIAADKEVLNLIDYIARLEGEVYIIGHSLGGRIAVKSLGHYNGFESKSVYVTSLAPAVSEDEITVSGCNFAKNTEIFYSKNDYILWLLYRLGQVTFKNALGYAGPQVYSDILSGVDVSRHENNKRIGHGDYENNLHSLLTTYSNNWDKFTK